MMLLIALLALQSAPAAPEEAKRELKVNFNLDAAFFAKADSDKDGALSLAEFQDALLSEADQAIAANPDAQKKFGAEQRAKFRSGLGAPFRMLDVNSDGRLTVSEMPRGKPAAE